MHIPADIQMLIFALTFSLEHTDCGMELEKNWSGKLVSIA